MRAVMVRLHVVVAFAVVVALLPLAPANARRSSTSAAPTVRLAAGAAGPFIEGEPVVPSILRTDLRDLPPADVPGPRNALRVQPRGAEEGGELIRPGVKRAPIRNTRVEGHDPLHTATTPGGFSNPSRNFQGQNGGFPPDPVGDVGPNHYIQAVNSTFDIWDKNGVELLGGARALQSLFNTDDQCETTSRGDPVVVYDQFAGRWVIMQFAFDRDSTGRIPPFFVCLAVSITGDPVAGGWFGYSFQITNFPDYPKLGVWPDAYYLTTNEGNAGIYALDRTNMLAGGTAAAPIRFQQAGALGANVLLPADADGATPPPAGAPAYFYRQVDGDNFGGSDRIELFQFSVNWTTPLLSTFTGPTAINMDAFDSDMCSFTEFAPCIPQPGVPRRLDALIEWPMWRLQYRNFGTHETLVGNFTVDVGDVDHAGVRWFELRQSGGSGWSVRQQGTIAPDEAHRWMGSIAMDGRGNIALGYSVSSPTDELNIFPTIRYVGRMADDPLGTMPHGEFTLIAGASSQTGCQTLSDGRCVGRWGDYASMNVDPVDDCTFWFTGEYMAAAASATRIGAFTFCNTPPTADAGGPYNTTEGTDVTLDGSGSTDPDGDALTYEWDLDDDGAFDDATGVSPAFTTVGQDGAFDVCLRVTDPSGEASTDCSTITVTNARPTIALETNAPKNEGSSVLVSGVVSDAGWLDPLTATIDWQDGAGAESLAGTIENGRPDATLTFSAEHTYGDNGTRAVEVCGSDDDSTTCTPIGVQIDNVQPSVQNDPDQVTDIDEGEFVGINSRFSDPGWQDTYTSSIDWGTGLPDAFTTGALSILFEGPPEDRGHVTDSHQYGDDGTFSVTTTVTDDDGGAGSSSFALAVDNVAPTAAIDTSAAMVINGVPTFVATIGESVEFSGRSTDPGSDDLTLAWDFDDGLPSPDNVTPYLVNPPTPDADPSATVQPRDETDTKSHAFSDACLYDIVFDAADDDTGSASDQAKVLIAGNADRRRGAGYWLHQYRQNGRGAFDVATLRCYLEISGYVSVLFDEERDASTIRAAVDVLDAPPGAPLAEVFDRQALAAWLNFANGGVAYDELVDTNRDRLPDTAFADVMTTAEAVRLDPTASAADLEEQKNILEAINTAHG